MEGISHDALSARWRKLTAHAECRVSAEAWLDRLLGAWSEPHRHYHNLEHLDECLRRLDEVATDCKNATAVELAIWFHDAIYDPRATNNEELSAAMAGQCLNELGGKKVQREVVEKLVLATKTHDACGDQDTAIMLDIDLANLGQSRERFARYEDDVRREFAWVPVEIFAQKRAEILEMFVERPSIYQTEWFREKLEDQARENLAWSIRRLRGEN